MLSWKLSCWSEFFLFHYSFIYPCMEPRLCGYFVNWCLYNWEANSRRYADYKIICIFLNDQWDAAISHSTVSVYTVMGNNLFTNSGTPCIHTTLIPRLFQEQEYTISRWGKNWSIFSKRMSFILLLMWYKKIKHVYLMVGEIWLNFVLGSEILWQWWESGFTDTLFR